MNKTTIIQTEIATKIQRILIRNRNAIGYFNRRPLTKLKLNINKLLGTAGGPRRRAAAAADRKCVVKQDGVGHVPGFTPTSATQRQVRYNLQVVR